MTAHDESARASARWRSALIKALVALLLLTCLSWGLALLPLGRASYAVALVIAVVKSTIVALVFMELARAHFTLRFIAVLTFGFIALICLGIVADVLFR